MKIRDLTDAQLQARGYHWKIARYKSNDRLAFVTPIDKHWNKCLRIVPKFWIPARLAVLIFRCFKFEMHAQMSVWLADGDLNSTVHANWEDAKK